MTQRPPLDVLVVDDEPDVLLMLRGFLRHRDGFGPVREASGGLDAVAQARARCPDAVILDLRMPDIDGLETARLIKARCKRAKIILFSAFMEDSIFDQAADAGIDACLPKTTTPDVVADMITNLCAS
ncbi:MAG TPA: response regulator transcription factor [Actinomycetota bacterium]|nr:response regulator transcription factor [Actinomycetota bacterium]